MNFRSGPIEGVELKALRKHSDHRGWLIELFRNDEVPGDFFPAMGYVSETEPGTIRGPHEHREQADFFCFMGPSTFKIYLWDARKESKTYGNKAVIEAGELNPQSMIIPAGVVHAYKNIGTKQGWVLNFPDRLYAGKNRHEPVDEIRHEDRPDTDFKVD